MSIERYYTINSKDGTYDGTKWSFANPLDSDPRFKNAYVSITQFTLTVSWYNVGGTFIWEEDDGVGGLTELTVTIPDGNYTQNSLNIILKELMDDESASNGNTYTYTITYDDDYDRFNITASANTFAVLSTGTLNEQMGFSTTVNTGQAITHDSQNFTNMHRYTVLYLKSNFFSSNVYNLDDGERTTIMGIIPVQGNSGDIIHVQFTHPTRMRTAVNMNTLDFFLQDYNNNDIDLRNGFWTATIRIQSI